MDTTLEEHLGYISDTGRLEKFGRALSAAVKPGDVVADLGCGFGILGLICLRAGAGRVFGIDSSDAIEIARETMVRAGLGDRYHCLRESSFRTVLPEQVDLIVCDHVGYFGFDYGIVKALGDARRRFLKPRGTIVPRRIDPVLAGIASAACRDKAEAWAAQTVPEEYRWLRDYGISSKHAHGFAREDLATAPVTLGTIDLEADCPAHFAFKASLRADRDGLLDGFGGWFECELTPGVWMTNSPLAEDRIDRPQVFLPLDRPAEVMAGDEIEVSLSIRHEEPIVAWTVSVPRTGYRAKHSTWQSRIVANADPGSRADRVARLNPEGGARKLVLEAVDGKRTCREIGELVLRDYPGLFPSSEAIADFVSRELGKNTQ